MGKLFGTDGIRALAGEFPLDEKTVRTIGASLARLLTQSLGRSPRFITGRDTRESGGWIEQAFHAGAVSEDASCESAAVITTPGVAYLTSAFGFDAGIVISASHNPYHDNGIKIFLPDGRKVGRDIESRIEEDIFAVTDTKVNSVDIDSSRIDEFYASYIDHLKINVPGLSTRGIKIIVDCANGAASAFAPKLFAGLGAEVIAIHDKPDGRNINDNCGSLHLEHLQAKVGEHKADIGVAFDGDADRSLFVDETGKIIDGDATLWILAEYLKSHGKLASSTVVATVMSNLGLELALRSRGVELMRADVGDKYVLDALIKTSSEIGGEQSGHIIFPEIGLVGDGMMTALLLLRAMNEKGVSLSQAASGFVQYPQILRNVRVAEKRPFAEVPEIATAAKQVEYELDGTGRLLLRYSGTENLARVMIEGKDQAVIEALAGRLADTIGRVLG
ncbi:MAG: phosphoglucosamine mutase [Pyrinomonadaceae bacterium]|nr:phosphoglucosamine mutase [Chloracidobacterium sp.]